MRSAGCYLNHAPTRQHRTDSIKALLHHRQDNQCQSRPPQVLTPREDVKPRVPTTAPVAHHLADECRASTVGGHRCRVAISEEFLYCVKAVGFASGQAACGRHAASGRSALRRRVPARVMLAEQSHLATVLHFAISLQYDHRAAILLTVAISGGLFITAGSPGRRDDYKAGSFGWGPR